ncbi:MAG: two-component system sensor histidine kinase ChvG [Gammaproteobacteria bacterium]
MTDKDLCGKLRPITNGMTPMSLRIKLLLIASILLSVPVVGYRYVVEMERFLREHQAEAALDSARTLALALSADNQLLDSMRSARRAARRDAFASPLFVHPIAHELQIDGYDEDWQELAISPHAPEINLRAASDGEALFILLKVRPGFASQLRMILDDRPAFRRAWWFDAQVPGPMIASEVPPEAGLIGPAHADSRILAANQRNGDERMIELRIPLSVGVTALSFEILNAQHNQQQMFETPLDEPFEHVLAVGRGEIVHRIPSRGFFDVRFAPRKLGSLLHSWAPAAGRRLRVIDHAARVVAQAGDFASGRRSFGVSTAFESLIDAHDDAPLTLAPVTLQLTGTQVDSALSGTPAVRIRRIHEDQPLVVSAAYPLHSANELVGALLLEESTSPAQALAKHALFELFLVVGMTFLIGTSVLLIVSGRLVARLRELRSQAAAAVDESGRVLRPFEPPADADEIGQLGRSFGAAVTRLQGYQDYLEKLARRLSHELRTPLTVIRTSLDNLSMSGSVAADDVYVERARHGVERLESIVRRMSEAARLEQAMADSERHEFDLSEVLQALLPMYRQSWPNNRFELRMPDRPCMMRGSSELIAQALDKLLANASDFADPESEISIHVESGSSESTHVVRLSVCNVGERLPVGDSAQLFESMSFERRATGPGAGEAHLGFGLYVVRLVAEFHAGRVFADDDPQTRMVCVGLELPCPRQ